MWEPKWKVQGYAAAFQAVVFTELEAEWGEAAVQLASALGQREPPGRDVGEMWLHPYRPLT